MFEITDELRVVIKEVERSGEKALQNDLGAVDIGRSHSV
jgi:hypothetical protein